VRKITPDAVPGRWRVMIRPVTVTRPSHLQAIMRQALGQLRAQQFQRMRNTDRFAARPESVVPANNANKYRASTPRLAHPSASR
ncbi:hypothetical protein, partial [Cypionkella sp.]|uniref:hypothetical protein n=1 Tax=Cypionkella sp. TaxID=2811411 RepID=UPI00262D27E9